MPAAAAPAPSGTRAPRPPERARVVVVGGGVMGCGLLYHLAHEGWTDTVLLEKGELTSGSTWHAAGQITHSTSSVGLARCVDYNIGLYSGALEAETGQSCTWHGCGSFRLAYTPDEMDWLCQTLSVGRGMGFPMEIVRPERVRELHPFYNLDGVIGALHTPEDGHADPTGVTNALAIGARNLGARIVRRCRATNIERQANGEWRVSYEQNGEAGHIDCEHVVNAGGTYARQMGEWSGLTLPMTSMTHHYFVTDRVPEFEGLERELPVIRDDREVSGYIRMEQLSGLIGIYEKENPNAVWIDHCPWDAENELFDPDYERVAPWLENALERMPVLAELGIKRAVHGAISHPPDGNPLVGPVAGAPNYWCCCGTQIGIGWGPGLTRELARWMVHGAADIAMRPFDPRRFGPYATKEWQVVKAREDYCLRHEIPFPHLNRLAGRPIKPSPLHERLEAKGAVFEEVYGHERPRFFARDGMAARDIDSFRRTAVDDMVAREVRAVRERVGLMDVTAFAKVEVSGPDAAALLDRLVANRLPRKGRVGLTHMLNERGRIELELTVARPADDRFYLTCAAFFEQRLLDHLAKHREGADVAVANLSDTWAALALQGPRASDVLEHCTDAPLDNGGFPWLGVREITVAEQPVLALRMSYAGELGWELHGPRDGFPAIYDALEAAGRPFGMEDTGSFAMNAMRMEKGFPGAGELTNEVTLCEAAVMRFVRLDKDFVGRDATRASQGQERWIRVLLAMESDGIADGHGGEAVLREGRPVGATSSVAYGPAVGVVLAHAYVEPGAAEPGTELQVLVLGEPRTARVLAEPPYDPASLRPRADAAASREAAE